MGIECNPSVWEENDETVWLLSDVPTLSKDLPQDGDVHQAIPKKIRPPKGSIYQRTESPRGDLAYYIISDGSPKPYRLKMRSPAFTALSVLNEISRGWMLSDVIAILGSLDIVLGEIDR